MLNPVHVECEVMEYLAAFLTTSPYMSHFTPTLLKSLLAPTRTISFSLSTPLKDLIIFFLTFLQLPSLLVDVQIVKQESVGDLIYELRLRAVRPRRKGSLRGFVGRQLSVSSTVKYCRIHSCSTPPNPVD
jgi:hypothetical protein